MCRDTAAEDDDDDAVGGEGGDRWLRELVLSFNAMSGGRKA